MEGKTSYGSEDRRKNRKKENTLETYKKINIGINGMSKDRVELKRMTDRD